MKHLIAMLVLALLATACTDGSSLPSPTTSGPPDGGDARSVEWDGSVAVRAGDVVRVPWSSLDVQVLDINDSRCPAGPDNDIACVWEGNVVVDLRFVSDGGAVVDRQLEGIVDSGETVYGESPSTRFDLVDVTAVGINDQGVVTLDFAGLD